MATIYSREEFKKERQRILRELRHALFIYPTDTIYGIGCDATDEHLVKNVRRIKQREDLPFSVIAPSKEWIRTYCVVDERSEEWLAKLPGPYTLILKLKKKGAIARSVNNGRETLGVRIPNHWSREIVEELNIPIITTSVNRTGNANMIGLDDLDPAIEKSVDLILYDGKLDGRPSTIIRLETDDVSIEER